MHMAVSQTYGPPFGSLHKKNRSILRSMLGPLILASSHMHHKFEQYRGSRRT